MVIGCIKSTHCYSLALTCHFTMKHEFDILKVFDKRMKKKILQAIGMRWRQFKSDLTSKWALAKGKDDDDDETVCKKYGISKDKWNQFFQSYRDPSWEVSCGYCF